MKYPIYSDSWREWPRHNMAVNRTCAKKAAQAGYLYVGRRKSVPAELFKEVICLHFASLVWHF